MLIETIGAEAELHEFRGELFVTDNQGNASPAASKTITVTGLAGTSRVYDGGTSATATGTPTLAGTIAGDDISIAGTPTYTFATEDVGTGIAIATTGFTLAGDDAGNYTLTQPTLSASITPKALTVTGLTGVGRTYDRTTAATASESCCAVSLVPIAARWYSA